MAELNNYREVGIFDLLSAPLNPIGAFDAEQFKKDVRSLIDARPDDKYLAVDLIGLDFVYSDAYNAFLQFQAELSSKGGMLALLSNSATIMDGLKKAGLDRKLKIFAAEADMMSYSLQNDSPAEDSVPASEEPVRAAVASQNVSSSGEAHVSAASTSLERKTGLHRRFNKSFNAIVKDEKKLAKKGMAMPFEEEKSSGATIVIIITVLIILGALAAFLLTR